MNFTEQDINDILDSDISPISTSPWKHGSMSKYIVRRDGKHYEVNIPFHPYEGAQIYGGVNGYEVVPVEKTVTEWVRVPTISQAPIPAGPSVAHKEDKQ